MENTENTNELWEVNTTPQEQHPENDKEKKNKSNSGEGREESNRYNHPNRIPVTINGDSPIVVFFGETSCGKTMSLVRLTRWLRNNGYTVEPVREFRPGDDEEYKKIRNKFDEVVETSTKVPRTEQLDFMLLKVQENSTGESVCQLLETPGEHFTQAELPMYLETIRDVNNKKIWMFFVEIESDRDRTAFVRRIRGLEPMIRWKNNEDSVVFVCHKVDKKSDSPVYYNNGIPRDTVFRNNIANNYPGLFNIFTTEGWLGREKFDFITFSAGTFHTTEDEGNVECKDKKNDSYRQSRNFFPEKMWKTILKCIIGGWFK